MQATSCLIDLKQFGFVAKYCASKGRESSHESPAIVAIASKLFVAVSEDSQSRLGCCRFGNILSVTLGASLLSELVEDVSMLAQLQAVIRASVKECAARFKPLSQFLLIPNEQDQDEIEEMLGHERFIRTPYLVVDKELIRQIQVFHGIRRTKLETTGLRVYQQGGMPLPVEKPDFPFSLVTNELADLRIFSNFQTKLDLKPTLDFWQPIQLYTTFSAYPWIRRFLTKVLSGIPNKQPRKILIAPCGSGDFIRFLPPELFASVEEIVGLDIRQDFLHLAETRVSAPNLDLLNIALGFVFEKLDKHFFGNHLNKTSSVELMAAAKKIFGNRFSSRAAYGPSFLETICNAFRQILSHHAVPDWYFPVKCLAASHGCSRAVLSEEMSSWVRKNRRVIDGLLVNLEGDLGALFPRPLFDEYRPCIPPKSLTLHRADLIRDTTIPQMRADLILCWEFIHVTRGNALEKFLGSLVRRLSEGGTIVATSIREARDTYPPEHREAKKILEINGCKVRSTMVSCRDKDVCFSSLLHYNYPVLVATKE